MRICYMLPTFGLSGGAMVALEHANRLAERGFDVSLINTGASNSIEWFPHSRLKLYSRHSNYPKDFDVVIVTGWTTAYLACLLDLNASRWIYLVQGDETLFPKDSVESVLAGATYQAPYEYLVIANWMKDWLAATYGTCSTVIVNALNPEMWFPDTPIAPRSAKLRILLEGPLHMERKRLDDAFAAVKHLEAEVWCVTNGTPKPGQRYDRLYMNVTYAEMRRLYSSCDVLLKMSSVESFGYPPLEMMACGGTAVITRFAGHEEYARDGENCFVIGIGDVAAATEKLRLLSHDSALLKKLKNNALQTARHKSTWDTSIDALQMYLESPPTQVPQWTVFERRTFETLAKVTERFVVDFHNNTLSASSDCLRRLIHVESQIAKFKRYTGVGLYRRIVKSWKNTQVQKINNI
jgi:glycosyltransferase involved in cell wall biosynthesis